MALQLPSLELVVAAACQLLPLPPPLPEKQQALGGWAASGQLRLPLEQPLPPQPALLMAD